MNPKEAHEPLVIRSAAVSDTEVVARIYIDSWNAGFGELILHPNRTVTPELIEAWRRNLAQPVPHRWWVAEQQGSIAGFAGIGPSRDPVGPQLGELDTIAIDPRCWRMGVGRELMSLALRYLATDSYREAILWTVAGYERGKAFYEAMGWSLDGGVRDEGRQIRYRRSLEDCWRLPSTATIKPMLLVDVDGVLNPYGFDQSPSGFTPYHFFPEDDYPVLLTDTHGAWLCELGAVFDMVWASAWEEEANRFIAPLFGLSRWPTIPFPPIPFDPAEKVPAIDLFVGDRHCAWVEDRMTKEAFDWAVRRTAPTLLIDVEPSIGLTREMVEQLLDWATSLAN